MHKKPLDPLADLDMHFLQPPVTEKMINDHWGAILLQLFEGKDQTDKQGLQETGNSRRAK